MAGYSARLWLLAAVILVCAPHTLCRNVTHEDIREAMMSLVHMFRSSEDKLERHEYREKALGDQLKRTLAGIDKKHRALEPLKGMISRLDERLSNVETILLQKEEREKATQKKTNDVLDAIQKALLSLTSTVNKNTKIPDEDNLTTTEDTLERRLDATDAKIDSLKGEIEKLKNTLSKEALHAMCLDVASDVNPLEKHISEAEKLLTKYELKLNEYNVTKVQTDFVPLNDVSMADEAWHSKMTEVMERQEMDIKKIQKLLSDAESMWKDLPRISHLQISTKHTLEAIERAKDDMIENDEKSISKITSKLREMTERLAATNEDIQKSLTQGNTMTERAYTDISNSYNTLRTEVQTLSKSEHIILQTADNVIATRKRVEYGVHQILAEVGDLVTAHAKHLNKTLHERFENIEAMTLDNQLVTRSNLSDKIESEMAPVWRQIGIMYKQLTANKESLDKLTEQTELYVNGSANAMENIDSKVGTIKSRMSEVDENLNYLLGRLSLVTQEFNQIKTGLGEALEKAKTGLSTVQAKLEDAGPGPHNITSAETSP
ncbi:collectin-12 [Achroia grisella]|uniref:collectin-12 n=1 Tax=Achroia grisella TaxID=688607 RepID=UPI0027D29228|nr:collectin-12 [Achroia grisella]